MSVPSPAFRSPQFLLGHIRSIMAFYHPRCIDSGGGYYHYFKDDCSLYRKRERHLVSSTRFVVNYALAFRRFGQVEYLDAARHGVDFLRRAHRNPETGGYAWTLLDGVPQDATNHCYGLAFVLLAYARALEAGIAEAGEYLEETWQLLERRFWEPAHGLYADEAN